jgi:hypothetical protein
VIVTFLAFASAAGSANIDLMHAREKVIAEYVARPSAKLKDYGKCKASGAHVTGINWYMVDWTCADGMKAPSTSTAFKFEEGKTEIVEVQAANVPVFVTHG